MADLSDRLKKARAERVQEAENRIEQKLQTLDEKFLKAVESLFPTRRDGTFVPDVDWSTIEQFELILDQLAQGYGFASAPTTVDDEPQPADEPASVRSDTPRSREGQWRPRDDRRTGSSRQGRRSNVQLREEPLPGPPRDDQPQGTVYRKPEPGVQGSAEQLLDELRASLSGAAATQEQERVVPVRSATEPTGAKSTTTSSRPGGSWRDVLRRRPQGSDGSY